MVTDAAAFSQERYLKIGLLLCERSVRVVTGGQKDPPASGILA